jgi:DNA replication protein DnaC
MSNFPENTIYADACFSRVILREPEISRLQAWTKKPVDALIFTGPSSIGKTYFCAALVNRLKEKKIPYRYFEEATFFASLKEIFGMPGWCEEKLIEKYADTPFVILDDLGSSQMNPWQKSKLLLLIDRCLINPECRLIVTSNLSRMRMKEVFSNDHNNPEEGARILSRLFQETNVILELPPDEPDLRSIRKSLVTVEKS